VRSIRELFDVWPTTLWPLDYSEQKLKGVKMAIADDGTAREQSGTAGYKVSLGASKNQVSIFNPSVVNNLLALYPPGEGATIFDPFCGGGTRAMVCAGAGYNYVGTEIRKDEVDAINQRVAAIDEEYQDTMAQSINIIHGDAMATGLPGESADMLITCPPYYDLEKYQGGEDDLSMAASYQDFLDMLAAVVQEATRVLKPGALSCWVIGLHRDKSSDLLPMHHDLAYIHYNQGYQFKEEIVLHMKNTGSIQRVGNFLKGNRLLVRVHEYCLIFRHPVPF
jgi:DNA modification methylase